MASKGGKDRSRKKAQEWTFLEKVFGVIIVILLVVAAYGFLVKDEVVQVESIETYAGSIDLRAGKEGFREYSFTRELREDYQVRMKYDLVEENGTGIRPNVHFKIWNETTGQKLVEDNIQTSYSRNIRIDAEDAAVYDFVWWVEGTSGRVRVDIDVLIQPTEKIFEKKT
jgi:hypothetical protein